MSLSLLLTKIKPLADAQLAACGARQLFFSLSDGRSQAQTVRASGKTSALAWQEGARRCQELARRQKLQVRWLRLDWPTDILQTDWGSLRRRFAAIRRNNFRWGIALDADLRQAFLETELNAREMLYGGSLNDKQARVELNRASFLAYAQQCFGAGCQPDFEAHQPVWVFAHQGLFVANDPAVAGLPGGQMGKNLAVHAVGGPTNASVAYEDPSVQSAGRRQTPVLRASTTLAFAQSATDYLARQVKKSGQYVYGYWPARGRRINSYNVLRHCGSTFALLEGYELLREGHQLAAAKRALGYIASELVRDYTRADGSSATFIVDVNGEIKLGANAICLLPLIKYDELTGDTSYRPLMQRLAASILQLQQADGSFVHVLDGADLSLKDRFRTVFYDGETAYGLLRLYALTGEPLWLAAVEKLYAYMIDAKHWQFHDHWLAYGTNELVLARPKEEYFRFGVKNIANYLDFLLRCNTIFPTVFELCMAFNAMLQRLDKHHPELKKVLHDLDRDKFRRALHHRAEFMLNGFFYPEMAMFFARPERLVGGLYTRHESFRVRIDDVQHALSGFVAYWRLKTELEKIIPPSD